MTVSLVVRKHRDGPGAYRLVAEEVVHEVDAQCAIRGWQRIGKPRLSFDNPTLTMALVNVQVEEKP